MTVSADGRTIWSPAERVGWPFYEQVKLLEKALAMPAA